MIRQKQGDRYKSKVRQNDRYTGEPISDIQKCTNKGTHARSVHKPAAVAARTYISAYNIRIWYISYTWCTLSLQKDLRLVHDEQNLDVVEMTRVNFDGFDGCK